MTQDISRKCNNIQALKKKKASVGIRKASESGKD